MLRSSISLLTSLPIWLLLFQLELLVLVFLWVRIGYNCPSHFLTSCPSFLLDISYEVEEIVNLICIPMSHRVFVFITERISPILFVYCIGSIKFTIWAISLALLFDDISIIFRVSIFTDYSPNLIEIAWSWRHAFRLSIWRLISILVGFIWWLISEFLIGIHCPSACSIYHTSLTICVTSIFWLVVAAFFLYWIHSRRTVCHSALWISNLLLLSFSCLRFSSLLPRINGICSILLINELWIAWQGTCWSESFLSSTAYLVHVWLVLLTEYHILLDRAHMTRSLIKVDRLIRLGPTT